MRRHSYAASQHRLYYNCPVKRPTHREGQVQWVAHVAECPRQVLCQPATQMGPVVYVRTSDDPRLYPPLPRDSATFKALMARRTGCERSAFDQITVNTYGKKFPPHLLGQDG